MIISLIVSILLIVLYVGISTWRTRKIPESISDMVYDLQKPWQWLWIVWIWSVSLLTFIPVIEVLSEKGMEGIGFATLVCLMFVGAMPLTYREKNRPHYVFAVLGGIISQVCVALLSPYLLLAWLIVPVLIVSKGMACFDKNKVILAEGICTVAEYMAMFFHIYNNY